MTLSLREGAHRKSTRVPNIQPSPRLSNRGPDIIGSEGMKKLILRCRQSPGDVVMLTAAVRDLHRLWPGRFSTDVRGSCPEFWFHNPNITRIEDNDVDAIFIDCEYPLIHKSNREPKHFLWGYCEFLGEKLGLRLEPTAFSGDIHLSDRECTWMPQVMEITGMDLPYWIIAAGGKYDYTIKWWSTERWQQVVDHFAGKVLFVQIGADEHHHPPLRNVIDLRGRTTLRELVRLVYHAQGVLCPVTCLMHLAAAVPVRPGRPKNRACVVVAGGREPSHWEAYPHHQYIHRNGALWCCDNGGCWKSRTVPLGDGNEQDNPHRLCVQPVQRASGERLGPLEYPAVIRGASAERDNEEVLPRCMEMITSEEVGRRIESYFEGGACSALQPNIWNEAISSYQLWRANAGPPRRLHQRRT